MDQPASSYCIPRQLVSVIWATRAGSSADFAAAEGSLTAEAVNAGGGAPVEAGLHME
jgi:hypothetical protein